MDVKLLRRDFLIGGSSSMLTAVASAQPVKAKPVENQSVTLEEQGNVRLLKAFLESWAKPNMDVVKICATYLAPKASVRWFDDEDVTIGPEASAASASRDGNGFSVTTKFLKIFARGPLVATSRIDTVNLPGKPPQKLEIAGVAIIKNGKIQEYCDYIISVA